MNHIAVARVTHLCPLARLNAVRWTIGGIAAALWLRAYVTSTARNEWSWLVLAALVATQSFGIVSSGLLLLSGRTGLLRRLTDWYGVVAAVMTWVLGTGGLLWYGISWVQGILLFIAAGTGFAWLGLVYAGMRPIRLDERERG